MAAFNQDGKVVNINDRVSIGGKVVSLTGAGSIAQITVQPTTGIVNFVARANDMQAVDATGAATGINGQFFGTVGDSVTVLGVVTAISGSGVNAILTVTLKTSQASIQAPAGSCRSVADVS
jgi:hypothetical protein